jgi:four helix bundle protein
MAEPTFDHERLDVYRRSIEYVAFSFGIATSLSDINRQTHDPWLRAAQSIPLNIAEGNGKQSLRGENRCFEIARGPALECAAIHDVLRVCDAISDESNTFFKSNLKRIVSMLTRRIQRTDYVAEDRIEYEHGTAMHSTSTFPTKNLQPQNDDEQSDQPKCSKSRRLMAEHLTRTRFSRALSQ